MFVETKFKIMKTNKNKVTSLISQFSKVIVITILTGQTFVACQSDDSINDTFIGDPTTASLKTISGNEIDINGVWETGCVQANNDMNLNESLTFNNENLVIEIKGYDNVSCDGSPNFGEQVSIIFQNSGTTNILYNGSQVIVNKVDGTATYTDGRVENFKQLFFIDDTNDEIYMHHSIFENDGGQVNTEGYPIEVIPISIIKTN